MISFSLLSVRNDKDLVGTDGELPSLVQILKRCPDYRPDDADQYSGHDCEWVTSTTGEFERIALANSFEPLLIELSVIQDPRLDVERPTAVVATGAYFAANVVSHLDSQNDPFFLRAWNESIKLLLEDPEHSEIPPVIPNIATYDSSYFALRFSQLVEEACQCSAGRPLAGEPYPEPVQFRGSNLYEAIISQKYQVRGGDNKCGVDDTSCMSKRYKFELLKNSATARPVQPSIRKLAFGFARQLVKGLDSAPRNLTKRLEALNALTDAFLLIVPFRRPGHSPFIQDGAMDSAKRTATQGNAANSTTTLTNRPGGCLFAIVRPTADLIPDYLPEDTVLRIVDWCPICERILRKGEILNGCCARHNETPVDRRGFDTLMQTRTDKLAINLSWMLFRAALLEAHTEIELRRRTLLGTALNTHHLPTQLGYMHQQARRVREYLQTASAPSEIREKIGLVLAWGEWLEGFCKFSVAAYEVHCGRRRTKALERDDVEPAVFNDWFEKELELVWNRLRPAFPNNSGPEVLQPPRLASTPSETMAYSDQLIAYCLYETLRNAFRHGDLSGPDSVRLSLSIEAKSQKQQILLTIENWVPSVDVEKAQQVLNNTSTMPLGLLSLKLASDVYSLREPLHRVFCDREGKWWFRAELVIGEFCYSR